MSNRVKTAGVSVLEILISLLILLVAILTMVGFTVLIHRSATESRRQAIASVEARSLFPLGSPLGGLRVSGVLQAEPPMVAC